MAKLHNFTICIAVIFSMATIINGRLKTHRSSATTKLSMPGTLVGNHGATVTDTSDLSSASVSRGKAGKANHQRERNRNRKSKKRPRKNRQRASASLQNIDSNDIIRETMIQMFGFNHMPPRSGCDGMDCSSHATHSSSTAAHEESLRNSLNPPQFNPTPPSFMLELYRSYSEDKDLMVLHSKSQGNTVRSFFPSPGMYQISRL